MSENEGMYVDTGLPDLTEEFLRSVPLAQSETIPSSWYTHEGFHELDREAVFATSWQYAGPASQIAEPGDFFPCEVAGNPVVVLQDQNQQIRAFFNVCRHRGGPLATSPGNGKMLQCQYHGWTYRLDGSLRGVPRFNFVELFDRRDYGLIGVHIEKWEELLFVSLEAAALPLGDTMNAIRRRILPVQLSRMRFTSWVRYDIRCNWKVYVDNYLEGYHLPFVHPELCRLLDYQNYKTEVSDGYSLQFSPLQPGENPYGSSEGEAFYFFVFPNFMLNIVPGRLQTNQVVATGPDRCSVYFDFYYEETESAQAQHRIEQDLRYSDTVQEEDMEICEYVQKGLQSRAYDRGRFSVECEGAVHHFQDELRSHYRRHLEKRREG